MSDQHRNIQRFHFYNTAFTSDEQKQIINTSNTNGIYNYLVDSVNPTDGRSTTDKLFLLSYEEAIDCYNRAIEIDPLNEEAWYAKALSLENLRRYEEALECYNKAIENNQYYEDHWVFKAECLIKLGRYEEAIELYNNLIISNQIGINPTIGYSWNRKVECYDKLIEINSSSEVLWVAQEWQ